MISAIAVDDEPLALQIIERYCSKLSFINLKGTFTKAGAALAFLKDNQVDLLFLDINMPVISGLEFYKQVSPETMVIFTTAYSHHAVEGFQLKAIDYILKPIEFDRFVQAAEKARDYFELKKTAATVNEAFIVLKLDYGLRKVFYADIHFAESIDNYIKVFLRDGSHFLVRMTMKAFEDELPADQFIRVHRSFIVRLGSIDSVRNKMVHIGEHLIPISLNYQKAFTDRFGA